MRTRDSRRIYEDLVPCFPETPEEEAGRTEFQAPCLDIHASYARYEEYLYVLPLRVKCLLKRSKKAARKCIDLLLRIEYHRLARSFSIEYKTAFEVATLHTS